MDSMKKTIWLTWFVLMFSATVWAQARLEVSIISGNTGEPIVGHVVEIENGGIGFSLERTTDKQGKVKLSGLSTSGTYRVVSPETRLYLPAHSGSFSLRSNQVQSVTLILLEKANYSLEEVSVVESSNARMNTVNAEVSAELTTREITQLPVEGRDITRVLYRLPNVTQATGFFPEAPNVSINGANGLYTNYTIDGLDNNENFLGGQKFAVPVGFVDNITVLTNNYSVEYGRTGNGVFDITTKSGSNETTGEVFYLLRPGPVLDASSPYAQRDLTGNAVKDGFQRHQFGFGLGGALRADKTFYYLNVEQTFDLKDNLVNVPQLGINETVPGQNRYTYVSGKLDHFWSSRFRSSIRVNMGLVSVDFQGGGLEGGSTFPSAGYKQDRNSLLVASKNIYTGDDFVSETNVQFSRFRWNYADPTNPTDPNVTVLDPQEQTVALLGHPGFVFDQTENTVQLQQKFTWYRDRHTIKAGAMAMSSGHELFSGGNPNGSYTVKLTQQQLGDLAASGIGSGLGIGDIPSDVEVLNYSVELQQKAFGTTQNRVSLYVEDLVAVSPQLNVTVGLRYDYDNLSKGGSESGDWNNIAPRFNANYRINENSSIRFGYGIFYDKIIYAIYSDALQQSSTSSDFKAQLQALIDGGQLPESTDIDAVTFDGNLSANIVGVDYLQGPPASDLQDQRETIFSNERRILNPTGYDNPMTHQFNLGYQHQVKGNMLFYVDLLHTRSQNLFRLVDVNAPAAYPIDPNNVEVRSQAQADKSRDVPVYDGSYAVADGDTLRGAARGVVITETDGNSRYYAANVNLVKERGKDKYAYRLSYTLSRLENNTEDINFRAQDANNFEDEWGPSINDRTHVLNGLLYLYPADGFSVSVAALLQSGQPINRIPDAQIYGTTDLNGDGRAFGDAYVGNSDRSPGESRNSDRLPWSTTFDLGVQYSFEFNEGGRMEIRADIFNLFNAENLSGYSNNATQSNQIQVGPADSGVLVRRNAAPPRQFQFGIRYLF